MNRVSHEPDSPASMPPLGDEHLGLFYAGILVETACAFAMISGHSHGGL